MRMPRLIVTAVLIEGRSKSEVAREYGVSRRWVINLVQRYLAEGEVGLERCSRRPRTSPCRTAEAVEDEIVAIRKELDRDGHEARGDDRSQRHAIRRVRPPPSRPDSPRRAVRARARHADRDRRRPPEPGEQSLQQYLEELGGSRTTLRTSPAVVRLRSDSSADRAGRVVASGRASARS
jgi:hypothetical protein